MMTAPELSSQDYRATQTILVTGGCGFIGANLVRGLDALGYHLRVIDDFSAGCPENVNDLDIDLIVGDICDRQLVEQAVEGCTAVVHLAAKSSVLESISDPAPTFHVNVGGTLTVLQAAVNCGIKRFVFASSNAALGEHEPPLDETQIPQPASPYGASKLAGEAYCLAHFASYGLETVVLRFSNVYGPYSGHKNSVVAKFIRAVLAGESIPIYGDGRQSRDFIYVADVVQAIVAALQADTAGEVFQIGTGRETTVLELTEMIGAVTGAMPNLQWAEQPSGEIRRNFTTTERAANELGFRAAWDLRAGLDATYSWLARAPQIARPEIGG